MVLDHVEHPLRSQAHVLRVRVYDLWQKYPLFMFYADSCTNVLYFRSFQLLEHSLGTIYTDLKTNDTAAQ